MTTINDTDTLMANNLTGYLELLTEDGLGPESHRTVRVCKRMTTEQLYAYSAAAQSEVRSIGTMVNLIADYALREAIQRLKADKLFKHATKKVCNELQGIIKSWKTDIRMLMEERYEPMEDAICDCMSEENDEFEMLRLQAKAYFLKKGNKHAEACSWAEVTQQMFAFSHMVIKDIVKAWYIQYGLDFTDVYKHMDLLYKCSKKWQKVCMSLYTYQEQDELVNHNTNFANAMRIYSNHIIDINGMQKHFQTCIEEHSDLFTDEDRQNLMKDIAQADAAIEAKANAERKANEAYWAHTRKIAKPRGSDITQEDLQQLKEHFTL